jgi:hypothetical protein
LAICLNDVLKHGDFYFKNPIFSIFKREYFFSIFFGKKSNGEGLKFLKVQIKTLVQGLEQKLFK